MRRDEEENHKKAMHSSSSSSSSRTKDSRDDNPASNKPETSANLVIIALPLSTLHTSSLLFFSRSNHLQRIVAESSSTLIRNLHNSIDKCLNSLHLFASQNPLFTKLHSLSSEYNNFCQMNSRNGRNLKSHNFAAIIPGDSVAGVVVSNGVLNFLNIYNTLLVVRLVLTWFPNSPPAIVSPLSTLCDPYLNIFRGVIPPLGGTLDLSPILAFLVLNALTSTASALPAELPSTQPSATPPSIISHLTSSQKKWMTRFHPKASKKDSTTIHD